MDSNDMLLALEGYKKVEGPLTSVNNPTVVVIEEYEDFANSPMGPKIYEYYFVTDDGPNKQEAIRKVQEEIKKWNVKNELDKAIQFPLKIVRVLSLREAFPGSQNSFVVVGNLVKLENEDTNCDTKKK